MSRAERYYQFINGLKDPLRSTVASWVPEDPDQAISTALRLSSLQRGGWEQSQGQTRGQSGHAGGRGRGRGRGQYHQVHAVSQHPQQHQQHIQPQHQQPQSSGHQDSVAVLNQQGSRDRGRGCARGNQGRAGRGRGRGVCKLCKKPGHWVSTCPKLDEAAKRLN